MYQNILVVGSIGSGKTSSAMYPFTKQLMKYRCSSSNEKLSFLILDVKGNYYSKVLDFAEKFNREYGETFKIPEPLIDNRVATII
jgi:ATP-dependent helicase YprA (DUF1998 family)